MHGGHRFRSSVLILGNVCDCKAASELGLPSILVSQFGKLNMNKKA